MALQYFAGKYGNFVVQSFDSKVFTMYSWSYVKDNGLVDITNTNSFGTEQYIGNLNSGSITADGRLNDVLFADIINNDALKAGDEILVDLYFDEANNIGFKNINCIVDDITFTMELDGAATYNLKALISEPKL